MSISGTVKVGWFLVGLGVGAFGATMLMKRELEKPIGEIEEYIPLEDREGFDDFETNNFMIGSLLTPIGLFAGVSGFAIGFKPEITKMTVKSAKYIQKENQNDLNEIANTTADIAKDAVTTTTKAVAHGITNEETMFCKHCGAKIDVDSKFCKSCGKEL